MLEEILRRLFLLDFFILDLNMFVNLVSLSFDIKYLTINIIPTKYPVTVARAAPPIPKLKKFNIYNIHNYIYKIRRY